MLEELIRNGQIATQYVAPDGTASEDPEWNPNGSICAIEGITSPDGRVFGKMAHSERYGDGIGKNIPERKIRRFLPPASHILRIKRRRSNMKVGFLGAGNMGGAILRAIAGSASFETAYMRNRPSAHSRLHRPQAAWFCHP